MREHYLPFSPRSPHSCPEGLGTLHLPLRGKGQPDEAMGRAVTTRLICRGGFLFAQGKSVRHRFLPVGKPRLSDLVRGKSAPGGGCAVSVHCHPKGSPQPSPSAVTFGLQFPGCAL